jgi:hypothetical protein
MRLAEQCSPDLTRDIGGATSSLEDNGSSAALLAMQLLTVSPLVRRVSWRGVL